MKIMHISDLHFSKEMHRDANSTHSDELLKGIESLIDLEGPDFLLVTGDITDKGDGQSLTNAREWLFNTVSIGGTDRIGLKMDPRKVFFIPGNHDAFNDKGSIISRILPYQRSLENFRKEFPVSEFNTVGEEEHGCRYFWLDKDGVQIYLCLVNSSYLGPTSGFDYPMRVACGRWLPEQASQVLAWYDFGISGKLQLPNGKGLIPASRFRGALKILMMHHYLFKPPIKRNLIQDLFLPIIKNNVNVKQNILLADFDLMLCGHKHIVWTDNRTYAQHLDKRETNRFLRTALKRQFGMTSSPLVSDSMGRRIKRSLLNSTFMLARRFRCKKLEGIPGLIEQYLYDVNEFERQLNELFTDKDPDFEELDESEIDAIVATLKGLTQSQRTVLALVATKQLKDCISALGTREFLHIMSGSSGKKTLEPDHRAVNLYEIVKNSSQINVKINQFLWGADPAKSSGKPWIFRNTGSITKLHEFKDSRRIP